MAMVRNVIEQKAHFPSPSRSFGNMIVECHFIISEILLTNLGFTPKNYYQSVFHAHAGDSIQINKHQLRNNYY